MVSRPQRIPLTHTLAPNRVGGILAMFQLGWIQMTSEECGKPDGVSIPTHTLDAEEYYPMQPI